MGTGKNRARKQGSSSERATPADDELPQEIRSALACYAELAYHHSRDAYAQAAVRRLQALFDRHFDRYGKQMIAFGRGDVAAAVASRLAGVQTNNLGMVAHEARLRMFKQITAELAGPNPTAMERLLAERAALCWLELHMQEERVVDEWWDEAPAGPRAVLERYRDRADRRYLGALKTLAVVRKLAAPYLAFVEEGGLPNTDRDAHAAGGGTPAQPGA